MTPLSNRKSNAMKKTTLAALLLVLARGLLAQDCATCHSSNTLSLTTGLNTSGVLLPPTGATDPYWRLINVAPPSTNGNGGILIPNAYTIPSFTGWNNIAGARTLNVIASQSFATNNSVASQPWRFLRKFYLCKSSTVHFVGDYAGDDQAILKIFDSNGTVLFTAPAAGFSASEHFDVNLDMHAGCAYMTVELANTGAGLMGFVVKADLSVTNNSLSNPSETCCGSSIISGQKILDANCNGKYDVGELPGVGWTVNLLSGSSVVQTSTTDANGEFIFYNVPNGTYTLQEVPQSGYIPGNPNSAQYTVVVSANNSVQTFQFFNCPAPPVCPCEGTVTVNQSGVSVTAQNNTSNANPVSTATTSFSFSSTVSVSEVRVLVDEFRLTTVTGNENCTLCRNKPQTWANINASSLTGVANQTNANPTVLQSDIRELVFNNGAGTFFNLNGKTLNLTLGVPGVTGLSCCTLKAEVCVKIIIRDVNCCEREIRKCFAFNLQ
jgi:SdrD B-like domain